MLRHLLRMNKKLHEKKKRLQSLPIGVVITFMCNKKEIIRLEKKLLLHSKYPIWIHEKNVWTEQMIPDDYSVEE